MGIVVFLCTLLLVAVVVMVLAAPLRAAQEAREDPDAEQQQPAAHQPGQSRDALEAAREAKYREIRDAELDFRTGKLSAEDYQTIDSELRSEALAILNRLEALQADEAMDSPEAS